MQIQVFGYIDILINDLFFWHKPPLGELVPAEIIIRALW